MQPEPQRTRYGVGDFIGVPGTLYHVEALLGSGGMGEAYRAFDRSLNVPVVIKVLQRHLVGTSVQRRFEFEARAIARIESANVVRVTRLGITDDGAPFYVMEFLVGPSLSAALKRHPTGFRMDMAINIAIELLRGLEDIHERGIVHCDIKPDNLILHHDRGRMVVKIIDFGVMLVLDGAREREPWAGTPGYSAPEQIEEGTITPRADLFAVGLVLFEMLTGRRPYESFGTGESAARKRARAIAPLLSQYGDHYPPALVDALAKALAIGPAERFKSARELIFVLEKISNALDRRDVLDGLTDPDLIEVGAQLEEAARPVTRVELENATDPDGDMPLRMRQLRARTKLDRALGYVDTDPVALGQSPPPIAPRLKPRIVRTEPMPSAPRHRSILVPVGDLGRGSPSRPFAGDPTRLPNSVPPEEELSPSSALRYADGQPARVQRHGAPQPLNGGSAPHSGIPQVERARPPSESKVRSRPRPGRPGLGEQLLVFAICLGVFLASGGVTLYHCMPRSETPSSSTGGRP